MVRDIVKIVIGFCQIIANLGNLDLEWPVDLKVAMQCGPQLRSEWYCFSNSAGGDRVVFFS